MNKECTESQAYIFTNLVFCAELMANYLDELKDTKHYRQSFKSLCKSMSADCESILEKELPRMFTTDEMITINCMKSLKSLVEEISSSNAEDLLVISQIVRSFKDNREKVLEEMDIKLTTIVQPGI